MTEHKINCIIPIGETCNITFLLQKSKLKKHTTLFEWFVSNKLNNITNVLLKIINNTDNDIIKSNDNKIYIDDYNIYSGHYKYEEFKPIYLRRRDRLLDCINNNNNILFVRFESSINIYTNKDIDDFINVIKYINPNCDKIKLLLITPNENILHHPYLITEFYNKHSTDPYCETTEINDLFITALRKNGYNTENTIDISFDDKSII